MTITKVGRSVSVSVIYGSKPRDDGTHHIKHLISSSSLIDCGLLGSRTVAVCTFTAISAPAEGFEQGYVATGDLIRPFSQAGLPHCTTSATGGGFEYSASATT